MVLRGEGNQFLHLLLGVETAYGHLHVVHANTETSQFRQTGILLYLYAPCLVIGKVQVQGIHLVSGHLHHHAFQILEGDEYAAGVDHQFAHPGTWAVLYGHGIEVCQLSALLLGDKHLVEGHYTIEHTRGIGTRDVDSLFVNDKPVGLLAVNLVVNAEGDGALALVEVLDAEPMAQNLPEALLLVDQG